MVMMPVYRTNYYIFIIRPIYFNEAGFKNFILRIKIQFLIYSQYY